MDISTTKRTTATRLIQKSLDQQTMDAHCSAVPDAATATISPCPSEESYTSPTAAVSTTAKSSNIEHKYHVDPRVLGTGHHGAVRECFNRTTGQRYAVKTMCKSDPAIRLDGITREISLLQEMKHRSIIELVDVYEDTKYVHLVTELCQGGELFDQILVKTSADNGSACFTEDEAAKIIHQILTSVSYMHRLGIVHRDLKPENILFETTDEDSPVKIIDFGLAQKHSRGLEPPMTTIVGTPFYIAPEVLRRSYDKTCDLWSVGVITYILLCGYPPFNGGTNHETHRAILRGRYYFSPEEWDDVSVEARDFVSQLLQMDPRRRMTVDQALMHPWLVNKMNRLVEDKWQDDWLVNHMNSFDEDELQNDETIEYAHKKIKGVKIPTTKSILRGLAMRKMRQSASDSYSYLS